jgi:hypothetical protein
MPVVAWSSRCAVGDRGFDRGEDQLLAGSRLGVGEAQALGRGAPLLEALALRLPAVDERVQPPADHGFEELDVHLQGLALHVVAADGDEHQLGADRDVRGGAAEHPGVEQGLALVHLAHGRRQRSAAADRLDLLDHQGPVGVVAQAVDAAMDPHGPAAVLEGVGDHDLAAVGGIAGERLLLVFAMDRLPEPHPFVAAAAGKAQASQWPFEEVGHREVQRQGLGVETGRHAA